MIRNHVALYLTLTGSYQPFTSTRLMASGMFIPRAGNSGVVYVHGSDGSDVPVGQFHPIQNMDLSTLQFKGTVSDHIDFLGSSL